MEAFDRKKIVREVLEDLISEGYAVVPNSVLKDINQNEKVKSLLSLKKLTPYQIAKFQLIPGVTSIPTVKKMTVDGRIGKKEFYFECYKMCIIPNAIKRLRGEN